MEGKVYLPLDHIRKEAERDKLTGALTVGLPRNFVTARHSVLQSEQPSYEGMYTELHYLRYC